MMEDCSEPGMAFGSAGDQRAHVRGDEPQIRMQPEEQVQLFFQRRGR